MEPVFGYRLERESFPYFDEDQKEKLSKPSEAQSLEKSVGAVLAAEQNYFSGA